MRGEQAGKDAQGGGASFHQQYRHHLRRRVAASLEFLVEANGKARLASARVLETNAPAFAKLLIQSLEDWRFDPAQLDGQKVAQLMVVEHSQRVQEP